MTPLVVAPEERTQERHLGGADSGRVQTLWAACYAVGVVLLLVPIMEISALAYPYQISEVRWRFGTAGLLSNGAGLLVLGLAILMVVAATRRDRRILRALSLMSAVAALVAVGLAAAFALDGLQLRGSVNPEVAAAFDVNMIKSEVVFLAVCVATGWLARGGWLASAPRA